MGVRARWFKALAVIVAGLVVGAAGAYAYSRHETKAYGAEVALVAQTGSQPVTGGVLATIANLVKTDIVAQNVIRNQGLPETSTQFFNTLRVKVAGSVITVDVSDPDQLKAVQIAQELSLVFTQLVRDRFGSTTSSAEVSIFDPAHAVGQVSPRVRRNVGWGALFGTLAGLLLANVFFLRGRRGVWTPMPYPYPYPTPALETSAPIALPPAEAPPALGSDSDEIADALLQQATADPFQTVLVAGDADGSLTAAIAEKLASRGELTMWIRATDADSGELDRLAARCSYVLVAAPAFDVQVARTFDAVITVGDGSPPAAPGVRLLGTVG